MYYDGTKILSLKDKNGEKPEIYCVCGNRTAGKTTYFNRYFINRFIKNKELFVLLYRNKYQVADAAQGFFNDIESLFFNGYKLTQKNRENNAYAELYLNDELCGFAICLKCVETIKRLSHIFNNVQRIMLDEFQTENNVYLKKEVQLLLSVHASIARGAGQMRRYVPVFLVGNYITMLNPYYTALGISAKLSKNTKFYKGDGFVLEQNINNEAVEAIQKSGISKAFSSIKYNQKNSEIEYLLDNNNFIEKIKDKDCKYLCTIKANDKEYSIKEYETKGLLYCDDRIDKTCKLVYTLNCADHEQRTILIGNNNLLINTLRGYFRSGLFRFKNLDCKEAIINFLSF